MGDPKFLSQLELADAFWFYKSGFVFFSCITGTMTGGGRVLKGRMGSSIGTEISQQEVSTKYTHIGDSVYQISLLEKKMVLIRLTQFFA